MDPDAYLRSRVRAVVDHQGSGVAAESTVDPGMMVTCLCLVRLMTSSYAMALPLQCAASL